MHLKSYVVKLFIFCKVILVVLVSEPPTATRRSRHSAPIKALKSNLMISQYRGNLFITAFSLTVKIRIAWCRHSLLNFMIHGGLQWSEWKVSCEFNVLLLHYADPVAYSGRHSGSYISTWTPCLPHPRNTNSTYPLLQMHALFSLPYHILHYFVL